MKAVLTFTGSQGRASVLRDELSRQDINIEGQYEFEPNGHLHNHVYIVDLSKANMSLPDFQKQMKTLAETLISTIKVQRADLFEETTRINYPVRRYPSRRYPSRTPN